jgi:alkylation response protein AidB-like acyl-CoA dehydrogenase
MTGHEKKPEKRPLNLQYDTEQVILRDSAHAFLRDHYDYKTHRRIAASDAGMSPELWREFAQLGWLGLPFSTDDGGIGGDPVETAILMETFGRFLVIEPYLETVLLGGGLISALGTAAERKALLEPIMEGKSLLAFADSDQTAPITATPTSHGFVLSGARKLVLAALLADQLLVSAQLDGDRLGVFVMPKTASALTMRPVRLVDGRRAADVELNGVEVPAKALLGGNDNAGAAVASVIDRAIAALSADAVGAIATMVSATVDYTKTRVQFGQPIAKFQALQHRMVRMRVAEEEARAFALFATLALDGPPEQRARAVSGAKAKIGRNARFVHQTAIQLHGAIGTTSELSLGAYAKRLMAYEALFGPTREHLRRYGALMAKPDRAAEGLLAAMA